MLGMGFYTKWGLGGMGHYMENEVPCGELRGGMLHGELGAVGSHRVQLLGLG